MATAATITRILAWLIGLRTVIWRLSYPSDGRRHAQFTTGPATNPRFTQRAGRRVEERRKALAFLGPRSSVQLVPSIATGA